MRRFALLLSHGLFQVCERTQLGRTSAGRITGPAKPIFCRCMTLCHYHLTCHRSRRRGQTASDASLLLTLPWHLLALWHPLCSRPLPCPQPLTFPRPRAPHLAPPRTPRLAPPRAPHHTPSQPLPRPHEHQHRFLKCEVYALCLRHGEHLPGHHNLPVYHFESRFHRAVVVYLSYFHALKLQWTHHRISTMQWRILCAQERMTYTEARKGGSLGS